MNPPTDPPRLRRRPLKGAVLVIERVYVASLTLGRAAEANGEGDVGVPQSWGRAGRRAAMYFRWRRSLGRRALRHPGARRDGLQPAGSLLSTSRGATPCGRASAEGDGTASWSRARISRFRTAGPVGDSRLGADWHWFPPRRGDHAYHGTGGQSRQGDTSPSADAIPDGRGVLVGVEDAAMRAVPDCSPSSRARRSVPPPHSCSS
jgi:hypothetical protein